MLFLYVVNICVLQTNLMACCYVLEVRCEVDEDRARHGAQTSLMQLVMQNCSLLRCLSVLCNGTERCFLYSESYFMMFCVDV